MKKIFKILFVSILAVFLLSSVGCSAYDSLEKALTDKGYKVTISSPEGEAIRGESQIEVKLHSFYNVKTTTGVAVFEFKNTDKMKDFCSQSQTLNDLVELSYQEDSSQEFYKELQNSGYAHGNCLIIPYGDEAEGITSMVKELNKNK